MAAHLLLDGKSLVPNDVDRAAHDRSTILALSDAARAAVIHSRSIVEEWVSEGKIIYGVTTGFGEFANVRIDAHQLEELQKNLVTSHAVGTGNFLAAEVVRAMILLRINALARGCSGIRIETLDTLMQVFNAGVIPAVPEQGSVGSSGDLVQLSHIALCILGLGHCLVDGELKPSAEVLKQHDIQPIKLQAKEGLAMINGTQMMSAMGSIAVTKARRLADVADIAGAMSTEALRGTDNAFDPRLQELRGYPGQKTTAANLRHLMQNSQIRDSHRENDEKVQDAYSIRCMPQVHGASRDAIDYVLGIIGIEINSVNDNPLILPDERRHIEGGNFHGQPLALALDFLTISCAELANISERRTERLVNGALSGLPRFLVPKDKGGLHSGFMIAQYNAASIVSENKVLAHPASVDSIPTSANQEDHNSMGSISARKALKVVDNLEKVLAIELLCAAQGIDFLRPLKSSDAIEKLHALIRSEIPFLDADRILHVDVAKMLKLLQDGQILNAIQLPT